MTFWQHVIVENKVLYVSGETGKMERRHVMYYISVDEFSRFQITSGVKGTSSCKIIVLVVSHDRGMHAKKLHREGEKNPKI